MKISEHIRQRRGIKRPPANPSTAKPSIVRCKATPRKRRFDTEDAAIAFLQRGDQQWRGQFAYVYPCECRGWHITRKRR